MIDLHSHLLPGIDDGAQNLDESLALARFAVEQGIRRSVLTPHIHAGRWENDRESIADAHLRLEQALINEGLPLEIGMAAEVRIGAEIMEMVLAERVPYLGRWKDQHVMLLELPHSHIPPGADQFVRWLKRQGVQAMIAHPERNKDVIRNLDAINPLIEAGCLLQVTAGSVAGQFGPMAHQRAEELLLRGWVTVLATDAHNMEYRPPDMLAGYRVACELVGEAEADALVKERPALISACHFDD